MAEFKLGRLRFVWKNEWASSTQYYTDDVVFYAGKTYICVLGHISQENFNNDLTATPGKWNLLAEGQTWKGDWQPQFQYEIGDIAIYGGRSYICITAHESAVDQTTGLEADSDKWNLFVEGLDWKGDWEVSFDYKENDFVKYGGNTYVCNTPHISAGTTSLGLENDSSKWTLFNSGFDYKGDWTTGTRYKINDVAKYGANLWIVTTHHTSTSSFSVDSSNWSKFVEGFNYEARWLYSTNYQTGDIVSYGGNQYIAKRENLNQKPPVSSNDWDLFSEGIRFLGDWGEDSTNFEYEIGDLVRLGGYTYRAVQDHTGQQPPDATYWERFNTGLDWRGQWLDDQEYFIGDVVRYDTNSYVCIQGHISEGDDQSSLGGAANSRPDLDVQGTYWNLIAIGTEQSVLTTTSDLLYYSSTGPARLPVGEFGQVLRVSQDLLPEWANLASTDDVYYVSEHGRDQPAPVFGKNIDRPWKTIRYATEQVEKGTKASKAVRLLELNRRFIQREIVEWTDYQITNGLSPFTTNFSYNSEKCERDMGLLVDAFIWDLAHGGNVKTREAALSYVNDTTGSPYLSQKTETVASINYGLSLIQKVLQQQAPDVNYQVTNGDNSTAIVEQYFEVALGDQSNIEYESTVTGKGDY